MKTKRQQGYSGKWYRVSEYESCRNLVYNINGKSFYK